MSEVCWRPVALALERRCNAARFEMHHGTTPPGPALATLLATCCGSARTLLQLGLRAAYSPPPDLT